MYIESLFQSGGITCVFLLNKTFSVLWNMSQFLLHEKTLALLLAQLKVFSAYNILVDARHPVLIQV